MSRLVERLSEKIVQSLPLEHLPEKIIWIEISVAEPTVLTRFTSKRVVMLTLLRVAETLVGLTHFFECFLRGWCVILVGMHF